MVGGRVAWLYLKLAPSQQSSAGHQSAAGVVKKGSTAQRPDENNSRERRYCCRSLPLALLGDHFSRDGAADSDREAARITESEAVRTCNHLATKPQVRWPWETRSLVENWDRSVCTWLKIVRYHVPSAGHR